MATTSLPARSAGYSTVVSEVSLTYPSDAGRSGAEGVLTVKVKKKCCRSTPRCRSCPVLALQKAREKAERKAAKKAAKKARKLARALG